VSAGSWKAFADALEAENRSLGELGAAALVLTGALISGSAAQIEADKDVLDARHTRYEHMHVRRSVMMKRAFGDLSLRQVCAYAPGPLRRTVYVALREMTERRTALLITVSNNKALITAGLQRISKTIRVLQNCMTEQTGTYKRGGIVSLTNGSVIVSRNA
jgi:hypothetical protein